MKAIIWTKYGPPEGLILQEIEKPTPKANEILVKVHATSVTAGDCEMRRLALPLSLSLPMRLFAGVLKPKRIRILGQEFSGEVVSVGEGVTNYRSGDLVFGTTGFKFGAYAETICLPAEPGDAQGVLAPKPEAVSFAEAAVLPTAGLEALHYIRESRLQPGDQVLIIGGGGSIGTYAIQLAKNAKAEVTGVDSAEKLDLMRSLGADQVIDYAVEDYLSKIATFDLIIDLVGRHAIPRRLKLLKPGGEYFLAFAQIRHLLLSRLTALTSDKKLLIQSSAQKREDLISLANMVESGKLKSVIDRQFPLEETADAHAYAEEGKKKGNISLIVIPETY